MIASLGPCLPLDLLEATGRHAGQLPWLLGAPTPHADRWLESKFPVWSRSIVEQWATGRFDELDAVVFSRGDDAVQRVYYYLCELQRVVPAAEHDCVELVEPAGRPLLDD